MFPVHMTIFAVQKTICSKTRIAFLFEGNLNLFSI